jgi:ABC-2 type transport system ATP-binding protein
MAVEAGEVFGFLGPNGAGKTTTIRMLLDLLRPSGGSASVFGLDSRRDSAAIRARLGNLPGDYAYDPRLSGREIVGFWPIGSRPTSTGRSASSRAAIARRSA